MRTKSTEPETSTRIYTGTFDVFMSTVHVGAVRLELYEPTRCPFQDDQRISLQLKMDLIETDGNKKVYKVQR